MDIKYLFNNKTFEEKLVLIKQAPLLLKYVQIDTEIFENLFEYCINCPIYDLFEKLNLYYSHYINESHIDKLIIAKRTLMLGKLELSDEKKMEIYKKYPPFFRFLDKKNLTEKIIKDFIKSEHYDLLSIENLKYKYMLLTVKNHPSMISILLRLTDEKYHFKLVKFFIKILIDKEILLNQNESKSFIEAVLKLNLDYLDLIVLEKIFTIESSILLLKTHHNYKEEASAIIDLIDQK